MNTLARPFKAAHPKLKLDPHFIELWRLQVEAKQRYLTSSTKASQDVNIKILKFIDDVTNHFPAKFIESEFKHEFELHVKNQSTACPSATLHKEDVVQLPNVDNHVNKILKMHKVFKEKTSSIVGSPQQAKTNIVRFFIYIPYYRDVFDRLCHPNNFTLYRTSTKQWTNVRP